MVIGQCGNWLTSEMVSVWDSDRRRGLTEVLDSASMYAVS